MTPPVAIELLLEQRQRLCPRLNGNRAQMFASHSVGATLERERAVSSSRAKEGGKTFFNRDRRRPHDRRRGLPKEMLNKTRKWLGGGETSPAFGKLETLLSPIELAIRTLSR